jgi:hypothetical protein
MNWIEKEFKDEHEVVSNGNPEGVYIYLIDIIGSYDVVSGDNSENKTIRLHDRQYK